MKILPLLLEDKLPLTAPKSVMAGPGESAPCDVCEKSIERSEVQYDFSFPHQGRMRDFRMHLACYQQWRSELGRAGTRTALAQMRTMACSRQATLRFLLTEFEVAHTLLAIARATQFPEIASRSRRRVWEIYERTNRFALLFKDQIEDAPKIMAELESLKTLLDELRTEPASRAGGGVDQN